MTGAERTGRRAGDEAGEGWAPYQRARRHDEPSLAVRAPDESGANGRRVGGPIR